MCAQCSEMFESPGMKNPRNSVSLPLDWSADNQTKTLNFVNDIPERMEANNLSHIKVIFFLKSVDKTINCIVKPID